MINFRDFTYFSMTYIFIEEDEDIVCEYEQTNASLKVAADGNSITFMLKNIDTNEDSEEYTTTLVKEADDEFYLKSSYFEDADEPYPLSVEVSDEEVSFTLASEDEVMYLYGFFA
jgi:hypothetical protein